MIMLNITPAEMEVYRQTARARSLARQARVAERRERAWAVARRAAELLKAEYGAMRVVVFGSLTAPAYFHASSDIDLAVWGMAEQRPYEAAGRLLELDPEFEIDPVEFEHARPVLQAAIEHEGVPL
jgi:predicted nucleotidyltransferase